MENRLLLRESTIGSISVSRCASRLQTLHLKRSAHTSPPSKDQPQLEAYQRDLQLYEIEMNKVARIIAVCDEELEEYASIEEDIHRRVELTEQRIRDLEEQLKQEKIIRKHKELVEACAMDVHRVDSKQYFDHEIRACDDGIVGVEQSLQLAAQKIQTRSLQYEELMSAIAALLAPLVDEDAAGKDLAVHEAMDADGDEEDERRYDREDRRRGHSSSNVISAEAHEGYDEDADTSAQNIEGQEDEIAMMANEAEDAAIEDDDQGNIMKEDDTTEHHMNPEDPIEEMPAR